MKNLFLITSQEISYAEIKEEIITLSNVWGGELEEIASEELPFENFNNMTSRNGLILLKGDPARKIDGIGSWLEFFGNWNQPLVILAKSLPSGDTPGSVFAYYSLCKELSIPVMGILQVGGVWDENKKSKDNLPWCGYLPSKFNEGMKKNDSILEENNLHDIVYFLRKNLIFSS